MFHVLLYVLHLIIQYVQALGRLIMRPLPHRGVCTDRKIEGCPRLLSRTPECPHGACSSEDDLRFLQQGAKACQPEAHRSSCFYFSLSRWRVIWIAMQELLGRIQCKPLLPCWCQQGTCSGGWPRQCHTLPQVCLTTHAQLPPLHLDSTLAWSDQVGVPQCSTSKPDSGDQSTNERQRATGTLQN